MRNEMLRWSFTLKIGVLEPYTDLTAQRHREQNPGGVHEDYRATQPRDGLKNGKFGLRPVQRSGQGQEAKYLTQHMDPVKGGADHRLYLRSLKKSDPVLREGGQLD